MQVILPLLVIEDEKTLVIILIILTKQISSTWFTIPITTSKNLAKWSFLNQLQKSNCDNLRTKENLEKNELSKRKKSKKAKTN